MKYQLFDWTVNEYVCADDILTFDDYHSALEFADALTGEPMADEYGHEIEVCIAMENYQ